MICYGFENTCRDVSLVLKEPVVWRRDAPPPRVAGAVEPKLVRQAQSLEAKGSAARADSTRAVGPQGELVRTLHRVGVA